MASTTFLEAAVAVLTKHSKGAPMHYRQITELAIKEGLIKTAGRTPEASMNAQITTAIRTAQGRGEQARFRAHGRGYFSLVALSPSVAHVVERHNDEVKRRLRARLAELDPRDFEVLIGQLLTALGFEDVEVTRYAGDGGIDLRGRLAVGGVTDVHTAIQVKRWAQNVSGRTVRELRGSLSPHERGLIITLSDFTKDAKREAAATDRTPVSLVSGTRLVELLAENGIGVTSRRVSLLELDEDALEPSAAPVEQEEPPDDVTGPLSGRQTDNRPLSVWPLPGGRPYTSALDAMLRYVAAEGPTVDQAIEWLMAQYGRVQSHKAVRCYWNVPRYFGLVETDGESLRLTPTGAAYLEDPSDAKLRDILVRGVAGFKEVIERLSRSPATAGELRDELNRRLGLTWGTDIQVNYRLNWLKDLGVVAKNGKRWTLADGAIAT
jgi:restriction system protein